MQRNYADTLPLTLLYRISRRGPSYLRNQQRRAFAKSALHHAALESHLRNQATIESPPQQFCPHTAEEPDENSHAEASSSPASQPVVWSQYQLSKFQEEDGRDEVDHFTGAPEVPAVNEDANAPPITGCQREASDQASSSNPWKQQGTSLLGYGHEVEKEELWRKVNRLRKIAHHYNDEAEEWFGKYMKYKRHEETRITSLLQRHFPLSNIAGYNLAQDKIIYLWDVQRREQRIGAEKERKKQLAKEAALASRARRSLNMY